MNDSIFDDKNRLAVLILAHKNFTQLKRLTNSLKHINIDIFIHFDTKMNISRHQINEIIEENNNVYVCSDSISANLDDWSLIQATMSLIKETHRISEQKEVKYKYTALLSGQDYPIKNLNYIISYLSEKYPKPLIDVTPYDKKNWVYHKFNRLPIQKKFDSYVNQYFQKGIIRKLVKAPFYFVFKIMSIFYTPYQSLKKHNINLYGGSAWWILPDDAINFINYEYTNPKNKKINLLRKTHTPEETFFQIMTMKSPVANLVDVNPKEMVAQNCMTYAYFSDKDKPFKGHPYIFTVDDYSKIISLPHLFARKFDETVDAKVFDLIDDKILNS